MSVSAIFGSAGGVAKKALIALAVPTVLALAGCGGSDGSDSSDTTTVDIDSDALVVAWDGTDCVYEGPAEVPAGSVAVDYVNNGGATSNLVVLKLDGITVQEVMDQFVPEPRTTGLTGSGYSDMGGDPPADPGETLQWERNLAPGEYVLLCTRSRVGGWFGSGLTVVEG